MVSGAAAGSALSSVAEDETVDRLTAAAMHSYFFGRFSVAITHFEMPWFGDCKVDTATNSHPVSPISLRTRSNCSESKSTPEKNGILVGIFRVRYSQERGMVCDGLKQIGLHGRRGDDGRLAVVDRTLGHDGMGQ